MTLNIDLLDVTNGNWYRDNYAAIVDRFLANNVRVVIGSPAVLGKLLAG